MRYVLRASLPVLDALALEFEATSYYVQQLYNTLHRSFIATSYPVSHKLYNTLHMVICGWLLAKRRSLAVHECCQMRVQSGGR